MRFNPHTPRCAPYNAPLRSSEVNALLGAPNGRLPEQGLPPVMIQGVKVWAEPMPASPGVNRWTGKPLRRFAIRVRAQCSCGWEGAFGRFHQHECRQTWNIYWAPEGRTIATVQAKDAEAAMRKTPAPYRKYRGEVYAEKAN